MKIVGWGNLAQDIQQNYRAGQRVLLEGRLSMNVVDRPEGFKEKQAEMTVQRIYDCGHHEYHADDRWHANQRGFRHQRCHCGRPSYPDNADSGCSYQSGPLTPQQKLIAAMTISPF